MTQSTSSDAQRAGWHGRWYLWDGGFLTLGRGSGAVVAGHAHHAIQVVVGLDGPTGLGDREGEIVPYAGAIVGADVPHRFHPMNALLAIIFVDPESHEGRWLQRSIRTPIEAIPPAKLARVTPVLRGVLEDPSDAPETAGLVHSVIRTLCAGPPPPRPLDPRIIRALQAIREMDTARISLNEVAATVFLSPSRFAHIFSQEVGLPFRRYVLWRRMTRAMLAVGRGSTLSAAAHACGFADSAHLTRTCYQMLGQAPSAMLQPGEFYEIPAPFELPYETA